MKKNEPPGPNNADKLHTLVRAGISTIPPFGGAAVEIFSMLVTPSLEKRRQKWMEEIADRIQALEKDKSIKIDELRKNNKKNPTI